MNDIIDKSRFFNTKKIAYAKFKKEFDDNFIINEECENIKIQITNNQIENDSLQNACNLILTRCQKAHISILRLCSEGHGEDAGVILRTLFDNFINLKYIIKSNSAEKFLAFFPIAKKLYFEKMNRNESLKTEIPITKEMMDKINSASEEVNHLFSDEEGKIEKKYENNGWAGINLRTMAEKVNEESSYIRIMGYFSLSVHCNPLGMAPFYNEKDKKVTFDSSASLNDVEFVLNQACDIFVRIAANWAMCYNINLPDNFLKFIKPNRISHENT